MTITYRFFINITNIFIFEKGEKANMKIKNLLLVPLLSAALVATSCSPAKGGDTSGSDTSGESQKVVTRVTVKQVSSVVVGDVLDFDTLVDVYYDDESTGKDYTLEAAAASKDLVKIEGNKVTILAEGDISISVKAGEQQAKFSTTAISQFKKDANEHFSAITNDFAVSIKEDGVTKLRQIHRPNYWYNPDYDPAGELTSGNGMMKFASGNSYEFEVAGGVVEVGEPTQYDYDDYFKSSDFELNVLGSVTKQDASGNPFLFFGSNMPNPMAEYGYYSANHYFIYNLTSLDFGSPYEVWDPVEQEYVYNDPAAGTEYEKWESMNLRLEKDEDQNDVYVFDCTYALYVVAEHQPATEEYQYEGENDTMKAGSEESAMDLVVTKLNAADPAFAAVEDIVNDPEKEPVSKDYTKVRDSVSTYLDGTNHNFTVASQSMYFNATASAVHDTFVESYTANEDVYDISVAVTDSGEDVFGLADKSRAGGFAVRTVELVDKLYSYNRSTNKGQEIDGKNSIYGDADIKADTFASLSTADLWSDVYVSSVELNETEHTETYTLKADRSLPLIKKLLSLTDAGYYYLNLATSIAATKYWYESLDEAIGYGGFARIVLGLDETNTNVVSIGFVYQAFLCYFGDTGQTYFISQVNISSFGSTAAVDLSGIDFE